jgi:lipid-A-disaccharide synthase
MAALGFRSAFPIEPLSVMGAADFLRAYPLGRRRADELADLASRETVDAAVLIDGWAFARGVAERMRRRALPTRLFKLAAPQLWASRPGRIKAVKRLFDGVLCLLPFEPDLYRKAGVRAEFVGNPNFQAAYAARGDGEGFRKAYGLEGVPLLLVAPGSRRSEIAHHLEPFGDAVALLAQRIPSLRIVAVVPPHLEKHSRPMRDWARIPILAPPQEKYDAFAAADAALAKSGTVTTELAINGTPFVVAYKVDRLTALWARLVKTSRFVTILNIAAGEEIVPELLQHRCRPEFLAAELLPLLTDREARLEQIEAFPKLLAHLGVAGPPAARLAAETILRWMREAPALTSRDRASAPAS